MNKRLDAVAEVIYRRSNPEGNWEGHSRIFKDVYRKQAETYLEAADEADSKQGVLRISTKELERIVNVARASAFPNPYGSKR